MTRATFPRVVLVTDPSFGDEPIVRCVERVARALPEGALCVQMRDKVRPRVSARLFAAVLRRVTRAEGARLLINGDAHIARDVEADGVHLGRGAGSVADARAICGRAAFVSMAAHSDEDVRKAVLAGADAVLVSPVYSTRAPCPGSNLKPGRGPVALRSARCIAPPRVAVYALGGVTPANASACAAAGADGVAVIRALVASAEPGRVGRALYDSVRIRC